MSAHSRSLKRDPSKSSSSITPQRKHHKLLKDGSGTEVWPEAVERIFVNGLREYWHSPWAASHTGRSRWRNQFLVDFLRKNGVHRTKKQVASHLQVLRNMWKGNPQFQLVAGADDLSPMSPAPFNNSFTSSPASPSVKLEDSISDMSVPAGTFTYPRVLVADPHGSPSTSFAEISDDLVSVSGSAASSIGSPGPPDFSAESDFFPPSPQSTAVSSVDSSPSAWQNYAQLPSLFTPLSNHKFGPESTLSPTVSSPSTAHPGPHLSVVQQYSLLQPSNQHQHHVLQHSSYQLPQQQQCVISSDDNDSGYPIAPPLRSATYPYLADSPRPSPDPATDSTCNRATTFCLLAEGMTPLTIKLDGLFLVSSTASPIPSQRTPPTCLRMRLRIPSSSDATSPDSLDGFTAHTYLSRMWNKSTRCVTKAYCHTDADFVPGIGIDPVKPEPLRSSTSVSSSSSYDGSNGRGNRKDRDPFAGSVCTGEEVGSLSPIEAGTSVAAALPHSVLSRCRWVDQAVCVITQEIIVDNEPMLYLVYELDRLQSLPSVELLWWRRCSNSRRVPGFSPNSNVAVNKSRAASISSALNRSFAMDASSSCADGAETSALISPSVSIGQMPCSMDVNPNRSVDA